MTTQRDGLTKGSNKILAAWASSEVSADLLTNVVWQLVVDEGRQRAKNAETPPRLMAMGFGWGMNRTFERGMFGHGVRRFPM